MSSKSRNRPTSSVRRGRSPRRKKTLSPGPHGRQGPIRGKRPSSRGNHDDERHSPKRSRSSPRNRRKSSPRQIPRGRRRSYSGSRDVPMDQPRNSQQFIVRESGSNRLRSDDKYVVDRPLFRGPDKDILMDRDSLKKIVVKMRDSPSGNDSIKRDIVNPEDINVVRRAGEGSRPIFDREEIVNYGRKFDEGERERKRVVSKSPVHSGQMHGSSERFRARDSYYEERHTGVRNYSRGRPPREYDSHAYERSREERSRYPPSGRRSRSRSRDRERDYPRERSERHDEREGHRAFRRSPERGRSDERLRRRPSPRRRMDDFRPERERRELDYRDRETVPADEYSDYAQEVHGYYEGDIRENPVLSPGRGRGHAFSLRRRGISASRAFPRPGEIIMHPAPPVRPVRGAFVPRVPGRRLPFPPRLVRPLVGPVIRVIAPVIPVRPPVLPVRPPTVIPVRHPVIPLPF